MDDVRSMLNSTEFQHVISTMSFSGSNDMSSDKLKSLIDDSSTFSEIQAMTGISLDFIHAMKPLMKVMADRLNVPASEETQLNIHIDEDNEGTLTLDATGVDPFDHQKFHIGVDLSERPATPVDEGGVNIRVNVDKI